MDVRVYAPPIFFAVETSTGQFVFATAAAGGVCMRHSRQGERKSVVVIKSKSAMERLSQPQRKIRPH